MRKGLNWIVRHLAHPIFWIIIYRQIDPVTLLEYIHTPSDLTMMKKSSWVMNCRGFVSLHSWACISFVKNKHMSHLKISDLYMNGSWDDVFVYFIPSAVKLFLTVLYNLLQYNFQFIALPMFKIIPCKIIFALAFYWSICMHLYVFSIASLFIPVYDRCYLVDTDVSPLHTSSGTDELLGGYNVQQRPLWSYINQKVILYQQHSALNTFPLKRAHAVLQCSVLIHVFIFDFDLHVFCKTQQGRRLRNSRLWTGLWLCDFIPWA